MVGLSIRNTKCHAPPSPSLSSRQKWAQQKQKGFTLFDDEYEAGDDENSIEGQAKKKPRKGKLKPGGNEAWRTDAYVALFKGCLGDALAPSTPTGAGAPSSAVALS